MFLNQLSYSEKKMFLDLSIHVAKANDELAAEEKALISAYCNEMQLPSIELFETEPLETVLDYFALCDIKTKKIVTLEILGLAYVDGTYDEAEHKVVQKFVDKTGISEEDFSNMKQIIEEYYSICHKMANAIE